MLVVGYYYIVILMIGKQWYCVANNEGVAQHHAVILGSENTEHSSL